MSGEWERIGSVEILRVRIYPADPASALGKGADILVPAGTYPVYRNAEGETRWVMTGKRNRREVKTERLGDGLFSLAARDVPERGDWLEVPSPTFSRDGFEEFLTDELCNPGPEQRLRFDLNRVTA